MGQGWTFASLFCGCGGLDLGFEQKGYRCIGALDSNPNAIDVHRLNLRAPAYICDVANYHRTPLKGSCPDVLLAGPPCQGFSTVGEMRNDDPRNLLLRAAVEIALDIRPRVFVLENVPGSMSSRFRQVWDDAADHMRERGYRTQTFSCHATDYGLPQRRRRIILLAWRDRHTVRTDLRKQSPSMLRTALASLTDLPNHNPILLPAQSSDAAIASRIRVGQRLSNVRSGPRYVHTWDIPEVFGRVSKRQRAILDAVVRLRRRDRIRANGDADPVPMAKIGAYLARDVMDDIRKLLANGYLRRCGGKIDLTRTFNGKFRRLSWDEPAPTVDTRFGQPRYFLHPVEDRGFTVREAARLQGFPDSFTFLGSEREQYVLVGNAVPPPMAAAIAELVRDCL